MESLKLISSGAAGALAGSAVVALSGFRAAGLMGGGSGVGTSAQNVGRTFGAIAGVAMYGVYRAAETEYHRVLEAEKKEESDHRG